MSAAASVGFSRLRAGVPVRDRERRVDLPNEPDSAALRRDRALPWGASCLFRVTLALIQMGREEDILVEIHGIWSLHTIIPNVTLVVRNVV